MKTKIFPGPDLDLVVLHFQTIASFQRPSQCCCPGWRGEVNRRSANQFYSMVQSANSHVRRLMNEKATHEQEMEEAKENFKNALTGILTQCK